MDGGTWHIDQRGLYLVVGMSAKKRQTFAKMTRERAVKEKRARKLEKKEEKRLAAEEGTGAEAVDGPFSESPFDENGELRPGFVLPGAEEALER